MTVRPQIKYRIEDVMFNKTLCLLLIPRDCISLGRSIVTNICIKISIVLQLFLHKLISRIISQNFTSINFFIAIVGKA